MNTYCRLFFFKGYGAHQDLHSFPTRRSPDLDLQRVSPGVREVERPDLPRDEVLKPAGVLYPDVQRLPGRRERSEEHTSELQSRQYLVCRLLLEKKKNNILHTI